MYLQLVRNTEVVIVIQTAVTFQPQNIDVNKTKDIEKLYIYIRNSHRVGAIIIPIGTHGY